jgi:hypothetical protein
MAKRFNWKRLTPEQRQERKETLNTWCNPPGTRYVITASGLVTTFPTDPDTRRTFIENDLHVDGADPHYQVFMDAVNEG